MNVVFVFMSGTALLVHPVTEQGATSVSVYLPEGIWYDFYSYTKFEPGHHTVPVDDDTVGFIYYISP